MRRNPGSIATGTALIAGASLALLAAVMGTVVPIHMTRIDRCPYCRTSIETRKVFGVTTYSRVRHNNFATFYMKDVDPSHTHHWDAADDWARYTFSTVHGTLASPPIGRFHPDLLLSVLRSLPTKHERKAFVQTYCEFSASDRLEEAMPTLEKAYRENPDRKDWPRILAESGVWP